MRLRTAAICPSRAVPSTRFFPTAFCSIFPRRMPASHCGRLHERCIPPEASLYKCQIVLAFAAFIIKPAGGFAKVAISMCVIGLRESWSRLSVRRSDPPASLWMVFFAQPTDQRCRFAPVEVSHRGLRFRDIAQNQWDTLSLDLCGGQSLYRGDE